MEPKLIRGTGTLAFQETCYTNNVTVLAALCLNIVNGKPFSTDTGKGRVVNKVTFLREQGIFGRVAQTEEKRLGG